MKYTLLVILAIGLVSACRPKPEEIRYGEDQCAYCKMNIADPKFGGELVTEKGRVYKFDAVECMVRFEKANDQSYRYVLVNLYDKPGKLFSADSALFVISDTIKSPMGANLASLSKAFHTRINIKRLDNAVVIQRWEDLKKEIGG